MTDNLSIPTPSVLDFIAHWEGVALSEKAAAQSHFIELCAVLGQSTPVAVDKTGSFYTFEKGVEKTSGGRGFADVWLKGHFAWEYKGPHKDLKAAYQQLLNYREDLVSPPLLVVCDLQRFEVHTNFTGTVKRVYAFTLADLASTEPVKDSTLPALEILRCLFTDPERLRPGITVEQVTEEAAAEFARLADGLRERGVEAHEAAHFLMRLLFCLFAEDIGLLPDRLLTRLVENTRKDALAFRPQVGALFAQMATGGFFGPEHIPYFNGGLFADDRSYDLGKKELDSLLRACRLDWTAVEPAIFGTLFERSLDPSKRAQLGAHYTSKEDILLIVEPVLMAPLRREWQEVQGKAQELIAKRDAATIVTTKNRYQRDLQNLLLDFTHRIAEVRVLDPACGSGNFLYVALKRLLDLQKEVSAFSLTSGATAIFPSVDPRQLYGLELNEYAQELAQVVVWIGYIQWLHDNGYGIPESPILKPLHNIEQRDAILAFDEEGKPVEPKWPEADVIIGNPPFLGGKRMRTELGDEYVDHLFAMYTGRVPHEADLVAYWFERARAMIEESACQRAGLLATQSIRAGANRQLLERINATGAIFYGQSDRPWVLDGADVRVSMVGFDDGSESHRLLNTDTHAPAGEALALATPVTSINSNLTVGADVTQARRLPQNLGICFQGPVKVGDFEIEDTIAQQMINSANPNGMPSSLVIKPWMNASDVTRRPRHMWIIDFGEMDLEDACLFEAPFEHVKRHVKPFREANNDWQRRTYWWRLGRSGSDLKRAKRGRTRVVVTPRVAKHRLFVWASVELIPDSRLFAFARDDDYFFGILHSRAHEVWSLATSSRHGVGNDPTYNNTTCFETFAFPWSLGSEPTGGRQIQAIAEYARELVEKRDRWLNPEGVTEAEVKQCTLTNLYNQRPQWLELAHRKLDEAVFDAYGWPHDLTDEQILERLLALNLERVGMQRQAAVPAAFHTS